MTDTKLGIQMAPWGGATELIELATMVKDVVDIVYVQDQMLARHSYAMLGALSQLGCGIGTNITHPIGRNVIEMASAAATFSELVAPGKEFVLGMGTGGALVNTVFEKHRTLTVMRESLTLIRALWDGQEVSLGDFPSLCARSHYKPDAVAKLTFDVPNRPHIVMAGVGPKIMEIAGELADGLISPSNLPTLSRSAFDTGTFGDISNVNIARRAHGDRADPMRLIYGINISVSRDGSSARKYAKRQATLSAGNPALWPGMRAVGMDLESAELVRKALDEGKGVAGAAEYCSDAISDALIISGTAEECIPKIAEIRELATAEGYREFYIGAPLGPDLHEAAQLISTEVIPAVWPERRQRG